MAITFIKKQLAATKEHNPDASLIRLLIKDMQGWEPARSLDVTHASDVTKPDFCPRKTCLLLIKGAKPEAQFINASLRATFDVGNATASLITNKWLSNRVIGNWECLSCGFTSNLSLQPGVKCCDHKNLHYKEMCFVHKDSGISGSLDAVIPVFTNKWSIIELKIIRPEDFASIQAPLAEHRIRTNLYMEIVENSGSSLVNMFDLDKAIVLYVSRGFGKKHTEFNQILPFKEFIVKRDKEAVKPYLEKGKVIKLFKEKGLIPKGCCMATTDKLAKFCPVATECFSANYKVGTIYDHAA